MDEHQKIAASVLVEEFKVRWQQILSLEQEVSRSSALYATALTLAIAWILGHDELSDFRSFLNKGANSYFVLSLGFLNALFALNIAFKGYQTQQIALYLYEVIAERLCELTGEPFNSWETWRRGTFRYHPKRGTPELLRMFYYMSMSITTFATSTAILGLYWYFVGRALPPTHNKNLFAYFVTVIIILHLIACLSTLSTNSQWNNTVSKIREKRASAQIESLRH